MADAALRTTSAGSLPKPDWLAEPKKLWAPWLLEGEALEQGKRRALRYQGDLLAVGQELSAARNAGG